MNDTTFIYQHRSVKGTIIITSNIIAPDGAASTEIINVISSFLQDTRVETAIIKNDSFKWSEIDKLVQIQIEQIRSWAGLRPLLGFLSLPDEVIGKILTQLNAKSLISITGTCKRLRTLGADEDLWRKLYSKVQTLLSIYSIMSV